MKLSDQEQKTYERYIEDRRYAQSLANTQKYDLQFAKEKAHNEGKAEGKKEKTIEIVKNMKANGVAPKTIADCTGLPLEGIEKL